MVRVVSAPSCFRPRSRALDAGSRRASLFRVLDQLSGRYRERDHRRCGGDHGHSSGRSSRCQAYARTGQRSLWPLPKTPSRRQRLRFGGDAWLAGRSAEDRAACHGVRQVDPNRRHLLTRGVRLRCRTRPLYLPWRQAAEHDRRSGKRRSDPPVSCDCERCALKDRCCPNTPARKVPRSIHECARDVARQIAISPQSRVSRRLRKKVEMLFAYLKRILRLDRLRLRDQTVRVMSSSSQPPPRTFESSQNSFRCPARQRLRQIRTTVPIPDCRS
jgi:hypothetical protein